MTLGPRQALKKSYFEILEIRRERYGDLLEVLNLPDHILQLLVMIAHRLVDGFRCGGVFLRKPCDVLHLADRVVHASHLFIEAHDDAADA